MVLAGWATDTDVLKRVLPGLVAMNPVTALAFILTGLSLELHARAKAHSRASRWADGLALLVLVTGFSRLMSYVMDWDWSPDRWLFPGSLDHDSFPLRNRMSPNAALCFICMACGLLLVNRTTQRGRRPAEMFALATGFMALLALLGYAYQVPWLYGVGTFIPMALHTAAVFLIASLGLFACRPKEGWMGVLVSRSPGGTLARRVIPVLIPALVLLGWLRLEGEKRGLFVAETGTTFYTVVTILTLSSLIWWTARSLHRADNVRRRLETEMERFFTLSLDMLCIAGTDGYFKRLNPAFGEILGYTDEELTSRPFIEFVHPEDRDRTTTESGEVNRGRVSGHFENRYRCKDGSYRWFWWKSHCLEKEGLIYATARDVTAQKQAEAEIRQLNSALEERATQMDATNQELEAFSYSVSHDLRAPLRGISGFAQALEEHPGLKLDDTARGYLLRVRRASERMGALIDDLLKLSRLTRAEMRLESVDLSAQATSICQQLQQRMPERRVEWNVAPGMVVRGDPALMRVLLENLLENAWKFTGRREVGRIEVGQKSAADPADSRPVWFVRDNGVGFDMRYAAKLFGAFQRLHSMAEFPGTGIGLATVQRVVRRHGGRVWAEAGVDAGAAFYFFV